MTSFQILEHYPKLTIFHHIEPDGTLWATAKRAILRQQPGGAWERVARFPFVAPRDYFTVPRPAARVLRADKCNLYVNGQGRALGIRAATVYALAAGEPPQPLFAIQGDCVLHGSICEDDEGWIYFGEYFMNPERQPVKVWRVAPDLARWEAAHQFPAGSVRHVHGVYRDPWDAAALWLAVGDYAGECFFFRTRDRFATLERFGDGSQAWRAVHLFFTPEDVCWLTDSQLETNHAYRMSRASGAVEQGQPLDAPAWYGAMTADGLYVTFTTVERGPAVQTGFSSVLVSRDAYHWETVYRYKKDFWRPRPVFKYGVVSVPSGVMRSNALYLSGEGLVGLDGRSVKVSIG